MTDSAVADADLMTLLPGREVRFSPSPESCWCRARRRTRSFVARWLRASPTATESRETGTTDAAEDDGMVTGAEASLGPAGFSARPQ